MRPISCDIDHAQAVKQTDRLIPIRGIREIRGQNALAPRLGPKEGRINRRCTQINADNGGSCLIRVHQRSSAVPSPGFHYHLLDLLRGIREIRGQYVLLCASAPPREILPK